MDVPDSLFWYSVSIIYFPLMSDGVTYSNCTVESVIL